MSYFLYLIFVNLTTNSVGKRLNKFQWVSQKFGGVIQKARIKTSNLLASSLNNNTGKSTAACVIPNLDPFNDEVTKYMEKASGKCELVVYGQIVDGAYHLKGEQFTDVTMQYIRRAQKQNEITKDNAVLFSEKFPVEKNENGEYMHQLDEDFIKVKMLVSGRAHQEFHAHVVKRESRLKDVQNLKGIL